MDYTNFINFNKGQNFIKNNEFCQNYTVNGARDKQGWNKSSFNGCWSCDNYQCEGHPYFDILGANGELPF